MIYMDMGGHMQKQWHPPSSPMTYQAWPVSWASLLPSPLTSPFAMTNGVSLVCMVDSYIHPGMAPSSALSMWLSLPSSQLDGSEARKCIHQLAFNSCYLHAGLNTLGFITCSHPFSPIVPLMIFNPGKLGAFSDMMWEQLMPIIMVVVGYPAMPLISSRVRFCVSAASYQGWHWYGIVGMWRGGQCTGFEARSWGEVVS